MLISFSLLRGFLPHPCAKPFPAQTGCSRTLSASRFLSLFLLIVQKTPLAPRLPCPKAIPLLEPTGRSLALAAARAPSRIEKSIDASPSLSKGHSTARTHRPLAGSLCRSSTFSCRYSLSLSLFIFDS
ncbi:hypothetical protein AMTRI_Chr01g109000 [Amborella trichopoda]